MRLIPDTVFEFKSNAERKIFDLLGAVDPGPGWTAFHSLNCSEHAYKQWAEIDFLVIGPEGGLVLEVKGGRIRSEDGIWIHTDRFGRERRNNEGPFGQARSAMFALLDLLTDRYALDAGLRDRLFLGWGVVLPDIDWDEVGPEMPPETVAGLTATADPARFGRYLKNLLGYWRSKRSNAGRLDASDLSRLRQAIRPNVDVYPPLSSSIGTTLDQMQRLTEEQYERLEIIEHNQRALISGGAGTGKTYLLIQCARRELARERSVLVVVHSPVLAEWLQVLETDPRLRIVPYDRLKEPGNPVDVLLVDEGQDLLDFDVLSRLSEHLKGGLDRGRWRWFMDDENQAHVAGAYDEEAATYLREGLLGGAPVQVPLLRNVRNTKEVSGAVRDWTGADIGRPEAGGFGNRPSIVEVNNAADLPALLGSTIEELLDQGIDYGQMGIVLPLGCDGAFLDQLSPRIRRHLMPLDVQTVRAQLTTRIVWGTVDAFKGLERPVVLCAGFDDAEFASGRVSELYVAATRANYGLVVFTTPRLAAAMKDAKRTLIEDEETAI